VGSKLRENRSISHPQFEQNASGRARLRLGRRAISRWALSSSSDGASTSRPQASPSRGLKPLLGVALIAAIILVAGGCRRYCLDPNKPNLGGKPEVTNPLIVPLVDRWYVMDQISDELDDYFRIYREERIRIIDSVMTEGWIETHPRIGSTLLEPWHKDSTPGFEKAHATLQTVRRFAKVRVIPTGTNYAVDVKVFKELEDLEQPIGSAVSGQIIRHDNALDVDRLNPWIATRREGWIPMGRDISLEQLILRNIQNRLDNSNP
jgi:hypothetical protein